jgi:hypothetical protein
VTAVLGRLRPADRERERELAALDRLVREPSRQQPPPVPAAIHVLAAARGGRDEEAER